MSKHYKLKFTQDRQTYKTLVIPAVSLVDAYIIIQNRYPDAEITEASEDCRVTETWAQVIAKHMLNSSFDEVEAFVGDLDEEKHEEFVRAIWDEWHKMNAAKVNNG